MIYSIAIDGPAGAGKSTIAKGLAAKLGFTYVDTGAMYRAIAFWFLSHEIKIEDEEKIAENIDDISIYIDYKNGIQQLFLNGENITNKLREEEVGKGASIVSKYACVRNKLVELQQKIAQEKSVIMDGRDIGTKVLPNASLKIFMTADAQVRARRRFEELCLKDDDCDYNTILKDIQERDYADENRVISPLKPAQDAIIIDTSHLSAEEVIEKIFTLFDEKVK